MQFNFYFILPPQKEKIFLIRQGKRFLLFFTSLASGLFCPRAGKTTSPVASRLLSEAFVREATLASGLLSQLLECRSSLACGLFFPRSGM
jgi:hypothetical protein